MAKRRGVKGAAAAAKAAPRDRVVRMERRPAGEVQEHPLNWRVHGKDQTAVLGDLMGEIGYTTPVNCYVPRAGDRLVDEGVLVNGTLRKLTAGVPCMYDGHLRRTSVPADFEIPCNVTDLTEEEALKALATADPVSAMAAQDDHKLMEVLSQIDSESAAIQKMLADLVDVPEGGGDEDNSGGGEQPGSFQILVTCSGEEQQRELIEEFLGRGVEHKALLA